MESRAGNGTTLATKTKGFDDDEEEEIPLGVTIHVMEEEDDDDEEEALGKTTKKKTKNERNGILKLRAPSRIREEIEQKIPFL